MNSNKNKYREILSMLKHMPEDINIDLEEERRTFFDNIDSAKKPNLFKWSTYYKYAAILVIGMLVASYHYFGATNNQLQITKTEVPKGNTSKVILPDGSVVWLNADSKLTYHNFFQKNTRKVLLEGEGYFEVVKNKIPFVVQARDIEIKVLGTTFNVKSYREDEAVETALITGKVQLKIKDPLSVKNIDMVAGEKVIYKIKTSELYVKKEKNISEENKWIEGKLVFKEESFKSITHELSRIYDVAIKIKDDEIGKIILTASFDKNTQIDEIFKVLQIASNFNYKYEKNIWVITK